MGSIANFIYRFYYFFKKDWGPGTPFRYTWVRPWLGGEFRHDSLTVVVYLYLRLEIAALRFRLVVNLYPNES
ncbi:hypothetical protein Hanom_Chr03g00226591 [Helianthus anomalus]